MTGLDDELEDGDDVVRAVVSWGWGWVRVETFDRVVATFFGGASETPAVWLVASPGATLGESVVNAEVVVAVVEPVGGCCSVPGGEPGREEATEVLEGALPRSLVSGLVLVVLRKKGVRDVKVGAAMVSVVAYDEVETDKLVDAVVAGPLDGPAVDCAGFVAIRVSDVVLLELFTTLGVEVTAELPLVVVPGYEEALAFCPEADDVVKDRPVVPTLRGVVDAAEDAAEDAVADAFVDAVTLTPADEETVPGERLLVGAAVEELELVSVVCVPVAADLVETPGPASRLDEGGSAAVVEEEDKAAAELVKVWPAVGGIDGRVTGMTLNGPEYEPCVSELALP
ncbi:hypothetical protein UVI_02062040 [Ustilaginoidea virens]|uniref:Uncharacterized protein n=1 Tax=Ustilaginoidea virens TaxID=1159556 RepID=A0A1B5L4Z9_USTVR|nr:hypothetical protein UVI_02062040 [Ustilaginoidea virens]